jgi:hypothetical protein
VERTVKNFPLPTLFSNQEIVLEATRSIGITSAVSDSHSNRYDMFIELKKGDKPAPLPSPKSIAIP